MKTVSFSFIAVAALIAAVTTTISFAARSLPPFNFSFPRVGDRFGTNIHFTRESAPGELAMLSRAFKVARMDLTWAQVETYPAGCGKYDFSKYDVLVSALDAVGVRPYLILDYSNKCYTKSSPGCDSPACIHGFSNFAAAVSANWPNRTDIFFEIINEPNGMGKDPAPVESELIKKAWRRFHSRNQTVLGPTTSGIPVPYLVECFAHGILNSLSAVSVHPYRPTEPETALEDLATLRALIDSRTQPGQERLPIVAGEWGYTSALPPCNYGDRVNSVALQGKYAVRMWLVDLLSSTVSGILYDWIDDGPNPTVCEQNFGSVYIQPTGNVAEPFRPKPSYLAALTFQETVGNAVAFRGRVNATLVNKLKLSPAERDAIEASLFVAAFLPSLQSSRLVYAVWHSGAVSANATYALQFKSSASGKECWNGRTVFGAKSGQPYCSDMSGVITVSAVTDGPLYLI